MTNISRKAKRFIYVDLFMEVIAKKSIFDIKLNHLQVTSDKHAKNRLDVLKSNQR